MQLTSSAGSSPVAVNSRTGAQLGDFSIRRATQSSKDGGGLSEDAGLLLSSSGSGHDDSTALTLPQSLVHAATGALTLANRGGSDAVSSFHTVDSYETSARHPKIFSPHMPSSPTTATAGSHNSGKFHKLHALVSCLFRRLPACSSTG